MRRGSFENDVRQATKKLIADMKRVRTATFIRVAESVIDDTPVKTGALKGSWRTTLNAPSEDFMVTLDPTGDSPKAELRSVLGTMQFGQPAYMTNNLPYSERAEYIGWERTPAYRMVARNIVGFATIGLRTGTGGGDIH